MGACLLDRQSLRLGISPKCKEPRPRWDGVLDSARFLDGQNGACAGSDAATQGGQVGGVRSTPTQKEDNQMSFKILRRLNGAFLSVVPVQAELAMIAGFMLELV